MNHKEAIDELRSIFSDLLNYDVQDVTSHIDLLSYKSPEGDSCLHHAAIRGNLRAVELLLAFKVDIDLQGDLGKTALHYASIFKNHTVYDFLLQNGASPDILNEFGKKAGDYLDP